jgi:hypothetical protein
MENSYKDSSQLTVVHSTPQVTQQYEGRWGGSLTVSNPQTEEERAMYSACASNPSVISDDHTKTAFEPLQPGLTPGHHSESLNAWKSEAPGVRFLIIFLTF